jgi:hypothetical protein
MCAGGGVSGGKPQTFSFLAGFAFGIVFPVRDSVAWLIISSFVNRPFDYL